MSLKTYINKVMSDDDRTVDTQFLRRVLNRICDGLDSKTSKTEVGNLSDLNTTAKTNIVAAINEAAQSGGSSPSTHTVSRLYWYDYDTEEAVEAQEVDFVPVPGDIIYDRYNHVSCIICSVTDGGSGTLHNNNKFALISHQEVEEEPEEVEEPQEEP